MKPPNPEIAIPSIRRSRDSAWLRGFRANLATVDAPEVIAAIDERLEELGETALRAAIGRPLANLSLIERVQEAVRVYETFLAFKHGGNLLIVMARLTGPPGAVPFSFSWSGRAEP